MTEAPSDWRKPYRTRDQSGDPASAGAVAWKWINARAEEAALIYGMENISIDAPVRDLARDGRTPSSTVFVLYHTTGPIAVATIFRDPMNFSILVRWVA